MSPSSGVFFCEGDEGARARLVSSGPCQPYGVAFHRAQVEAWGARPLIYADADAISLIRDALRCHEQVAGAALAPEEQARLNLLRALLVRDCLTLRDVRGPRPLRFEEDRLDFDLRSPNEWSHEREMRLILPFGGIGAPRAYWTFMEAAVAHLLLPAGHPEGLQAFARWVADEERARWALDMTVRLVDDEGRPGDGNTLGSYV
jgi:hypothetical protein